MNNDDLLIRLATEQDQVAIAGNYNPEMDAWAIMWRGQLSALAGVMDDGTMRRVFYDLKPGIEAPAKTVWRAAISIMQLIVKLEPPLIAIASLEYPRAKHFLERLGFYHYATEKGREFFVWP